VFELFSILIYKFRLRVNGGYYTLKLGFKYLHAYTYNILLLSSGINYQEWTNISLGKIDIFYV